MVFKTRVKYLKNITIVFFALNLYHHILQVFDYDWGLQDDFMGSCHLDLTALELGRNQDLVLCLRDPSKPAQDMGEIVLNVTLWPKSQEDKEQVGVFFLFFSLSILYPFRLF